MISVDAICADPEPRAEILFGHFGHNLCPEKLTM